MIQILIRKWDKSKEKNLNNIKGYNLLSIEEIGYYKCEREKILKDLEKHHDDHMNSCNEPEKIEKAMKNDMGQPNLSDKTTQKLEETTKKFKESAIKLKTLQKIVQERV